MINYIEMNEGANLLQRDLFQDGDLLHAVHQIEGRGQQGERTRLMGGTERHRDHVQQCRNSESDLATGNAHQNIHTQTDVRRQGESARVQEQGTHGGESGHGLA